MTTFFGYANTRMFLIQRNTKEFIHLIKRKRASFVQFNETNIAVYIYTLMLRDNKTELDTAKTCSKL